ncbi:putative helicase-like protein [Trypanosoma grayi]|uniref:putative helicase-like protein n=1 Tax=Trypanosoma grayi TaxID=71804 RepID=UPI0004F46365|nr:putative helicase-like protein [Trypanosoma grayi]KEG15342.1 putative helicase-like protein [Trypanosoma grayi]
MVVQAAAATNGGVAYAMPFEPYAVQAAMMQTITRCLHSSSPPIPVAAVEVPTGCGKTLALLSSVLSYQGALENLAPHELEQHLRARRWKHGAAASLSPSCEAKDDMEKNESNTMAASKRKENNSAETEEEQWGVPALFFKQFRARSGKRLRVEMDGTSSDLRRQHQPPPCTVFYVTRTHAQLQQTVGELRKLRGLHRLKMSILGSRERYCINHTVLKARANKTLPVGGNNLGEVCDKLVSLGQCEAVHSYGSLASRAISQPLCRGRTDKVWDMEDLVAEGVANQKCPYYAARDLVFFAHVSFATYQYLLDPLIRHECKMEAALKNHSIIVFDEAHNVPHVCQDALSVETPVDVLRLIVSEIEPLVAPAVGSIPTLSYPREFKLTQWTLVELFSLLHDVFNAIVSFVLRQESATVKHRVPQRRATDDDDDDAGRGPTLPGEVLANTIRRCILEYLPLALRNLGDACDSDASNKFTASTETVAMFRQVYGIVMSLGVTFNPFQFSIFGLSVMKRWLLVMRFILQKPAAFSVSIRDAISVNSGDFSGGRMAEPSAAPQRSVCVRCLDGSLAFHHLLDVAHRVVLASGTLAPFHQLGRDLGLPLTNMATYEGEHVVGGHQYRLSALTHMADAVQLHCNYGSLMDVSFISRLVNVIITLVDEVLLGGVLVFLPNYSVMHAVGSRVLSHYRSETRSGKARVTQVFVETRAAAELSPLLDAFRTASSRGTAVLVSVYRAKVSEGLDFADSMARLVVCVGIPLRPLKSWTVVAQRRYSGEEWYVTDAMRAVNQALGRCLRHCHDYGAMVLLDDRYEQAKLQGLLSKWCRGRLTVHHTPVSLVEGLQSFYRIAAQPSAPPREQQQQQQPASVEAKLLPEVMMKGSSAPKEKLRTQCSHAEALFPFSLGTVKRPRVTTCTHEWSCTAVKLLYEAHDAVDQVAAAELRETLHMLRNEYLEPPGDE